ncbi:MAG: hypothetical protein NTV55_08395 [Planctomycetota bacterium]|nr:hypothetical protein [Planctomycetota bacterium]RLS38695.1 MAG: hypothetical protein DWH82_07400 [Planctomycetota bacterium]
MPDHELRDRNGKLLGKVHISSNGRHEGRDANGRLKGTYDPKSNETRDANGRLIGKGDMLATLILSP